MLAYQLRKEHVIATAYTVQLLQSMRQTVPDSGSWESSTLLLPKVGPLDWPRFGGTQSELETVAAYRDSLAKSQNLQKAEGGGSRKGGNKEDDDE